MPKKKAKRNKTEKRYCWVIAYIDSKFITLVQQQLSRSIEFKEVEFFIPTVKILKKTFKGKEHFDEVPLLFNYGFFKIPRIYAVHKVYLENLQKQVSAIFGWVKDPSKIFKKKGKESIAGDDRYIACATATSKEIVDLIRTSQNLGAHSAEDLGLLKPGDMITLRGYPWDEVEAEFISMDLKRKKVKVKLKMLWGKEVEVTFDNVFFTIYHNSNYDDSLTIKKSLDEMQSRNALDKFIHKNTPNGAE
jgi:transcription antitermination factor NusG